MRSRFQLPAGLLLSLGAVLPALAQSPPSPARDEPAPAPAADASGRLKRIFGGQEGAESSGEAKATPEAPDAAAPERGYLGIQVVPEEDGMVVADVRPGGPAEAIGLEPGDRITRVGETRIQGGDIAFLQDLQAGQTIELRVERDGWVKETEVTLVSGAALEGGAAGDGGDREAQDREPSDFFRFGFEPEGEDEDEVRPRVFQNLPGFDGELRVYVDGEEVDVNELGELDLEHAGGVRIEMKSDAGGRQLRMLRDHIRDGVLRELHGRPASPAPDGDFVGLRREIDALRAELNEMREQRREEIAELREHVRVLIERVREDGLR